MTNEALRMSERGDAVFAALARQFPTASKWRLLIEQQLDARRFAAIRGALLAYVSRVLGSSDVLDEPAALQALLERRADLPSYTQGGMLAPTREQTLEFNLLHRSVVNALAEYDLDGQIEGIDLPINVRLVYGDVDEARAKAPFSSTKLHSDIWAGIPPDAAVVVLPVLGDIETLTIECYEMPREQELLAMRAMRDYDEGRPIEPSVAYSDCSMKHGHLYVADARLLHKTVRRKRGGVRLSIDFRFRYRDAGYRALTPAIERGGPDSVDCRVPYSQWCSAATDSLIVFSDTLESLRRRRSAASSSPVNLAEYRLLPLATAGDGRGL
jgi:hypothetical protein